MASLLKTRKFLLVVIVALVAGFVSAKFMAQGNPLVTLPWGVLAFLSAFLAGSRKEAWTLGGCLGFVASYSYLWFDSSDLTTSKVIGLVFLIILPALFGLLCGLLAAWLGWVVRKHAFGLPAKRVSKR